MCILSVLLYLLWHIFRYSHDCQIVNTRTTNLLLPVLLKLDQSKIPSCMHEFSCIDAGIRLFEKLPTSQTQLYNKCSHFYLSVFLHSICYLCFKKTSSFMGKKIRANNLVPKKNPAMPKQSKKAPPPITFLMVRP
jgi:hypothetical protein